MDDKGDMRMRAIAELALAVETGGDVDQAVQAAYMAGVEPYEIAELERAADAAGAGDPGAGGGLTFSSLVAG